MTKRNPIQLALLSLKGMAMGAADVVPGVSGGTIAFISGIYEELIESINSINLSALKTLKSKGIKAFWNQINGTFFTFLFIGVGISIFSLAKVVTYTLETFPVLIWSFFFGLIIASIWMVGKTIQKWSSGPIAAMAIGAVVAYYISSIQTVGVADANWYILLSGAIAICAMILPGISGSFILVLLGSYHIVLDGIKERNLMIVGLFGIGCAIGLLTFARLLKFLFAKYKGITIAILTGFMIGSLYKVWPWKNNIGDEPLVVHSNGKEDWMQVNVLPDNYVGDSNVMYAVLCCIGGFLLIYILQKFAPKEG